MLSIVRWFLGVRVVISKEDALRIAKEHCLSQSWPWNEPVHIILAVRNYEIMTNAAFKGGNVSIRIDCSTGVVTFAAYADR
jgi:hypothetical protein